MEHLPPVGWADVATKRDLDQLHDRLTAVIHQVESRMLRWTVRAVFSGVAPAFVAARFA